MRNVLTKVFWPILKFFETNEAPTSYKKSHRVILNIVGSLFIVLSLGSAGASYVSGGLDSLIPVIIFFSVGLVAIVVGSLGSDAAVAKIWGNK